MTIDEAESKQEEFDEILNVLNNYSARDQKYIEAKNRLLYNVNNFYEVRKKKLLKVLKMEHSAKS